MAEVELLEFHREGAAEERTAPAAALSEAAAGLRKLRDAIFSLS
jgi:hypothetical protein